MQIYEKGCMHISALQPKLGLHTYKPKQSQCGAVHSTKVPQATSLSRVSLEPLSYYKLAKVVNSQVPAIILICHVPCRHYRCAQTASSPRVQRSTGHVKTGYVQRKR